MFQWNVSILILYQARRGIGYSKVQNLQNVLETWKVEFVYSPPSLER